jgi:hypothetical protein
MRHWNVNGAVPETAMEKVAGCPATTAILAGCAAIEGAAAVVGSDVSELLTFFALVKPTQPAWIRHNSNRSGAVARKNQ